MFTIKKFSASETEWWERALAIRKAVFVDELGVDPSLEYENEAESVHYLLFLGEKALATARWRETGHGIKLERFAVLPAYRNRGIGEILLHEIIKEHTTSGRPVYLHAQARAADFYLRNGFSITGEPFSEAGITHYKMVWTGDGT